MKASAKLLPARRGQPACTAPRSRQRSTNPARGGRLRYGPPRNRRNSGLILGFDTSGPWVAAALIRQDALIASRAFAMERGQAEHLLPALEELIAPQGGWPAVTVLGCGIGPGNLTGTRISVAAARALALALGRPAIGVSLFEALALDLPRPCLVALDARRGETHAQRFDPAGAQAPALLPAGAALPLAGCAALIGDAPALKEAALTDTAPGPVLPLPEPARIAAAIARIAASRAGTPQPRPAPLYLRGADAAPPRELPPQLLP